MLGELRNGDRLKNNVNQFWNKSASTTILAHPLWNGLILGYVMQFFMQNPIYVTACRFVEFEASYAPNSRTSARVCKKSDLQRTFIKFLKFESVRKL